ncbi:MAG TPA: Na+/H+ antiporter NhaC, partial [Clostridiales bacterium UBA8960]|nr:Na+/H+ antiporter NhaC [Clostridiales bacterium UBA8960]
MESVRKPYFYEALLSFGGLMLVMAVGIAVFEANPHIPMLIGTAFASVIALKIGYKWKAIEESMFDGIRQALQAVVILAIIGVLIGVWILSGVVPSMVYYGLNILTPQIFLVATLLICSVTSLATGTSWGTAGTIGIALMGIASGLGIPAPIAAGAIISGAYFGDKMSPLSDTTNLAPAMAGTDVFTHVKFMLKPTLIAYSIAIVFFG